MIVTVVLTENTVTVDGVTYTVVLPNITEHKKVYSILWFGSGGEYDYNDGSMPTKLKESDYSSYVEPYVTAWEETRAFDLQNQEEQKAAEYAERHNPDYLAKKFRRERDKRLSKTDFYFQPDYPAISEENMKRVKAYRIALRDMTSLDGFPWDGGGEETPWPVLTLK